MSTSPQQRAQKLRDELNRHNHLYYIEAKPTISDQQYDRLMQELTELEAAHPELLTADSPTQRVGGAAIEGFVSVRHARPMMSIGNTYNKDEVVAWANSLRERLGDEDSQYVVEPKIDGVAASVRYENGVLTLVATRGDGSTGDDITASGRTIKALPLRLQTADAKPPAVLEVRGEIFMPNAIFQTINAERTEAGEETFKNPRNLTTGTLKQLDPKLTARRKLQFTVHGLGEHDLNERTDSYWESLQLLKRWGLPIPANTKRLESIEKVLEAIDEFETVRGTLSFQTDGMVVKLDSFKQRDTAGVTSKSPRWVTAYKYAAEQQQTVLLAVDWQVGKGGTLTPVARMEPVFVAGSTVRNATLHNFDRITELDLHIGDTLVIEKAGEVIPYVRQVVAEKRPAGAKPVPAPTHCPSCGTAVVRLPDTPHIRCPNESCPAQLVERLIWFVGRGQMDIDGLGERLVEQLIAAGHLKTFADLYKLTAADIAQLSSETEQDGKTVKRTVGEKIASKIVGNIEKSRQQPLDRLLAGLGVPHVGSRVAHLLASNFGSLDAITAASVEQIAAIHTLGDVIAESVNAYLHSPTGKATIKALQAAGIDPKQEVIKPEDIAALPFAGKSIVVTGTLPTLKRDEIETLITKNGGKPSGSVSKKTAFLVAGEDAGSKLTKAKDLGVEIIDEAEFLKRVGT